MIDWDEQVQVKGLFPDRVVWDGINLAEAVKRVMALPADKRGEMTVFAASGAYSGREIEDLYQRLIDEPICPICQRKVETLDKTGDWTGYDCPGHGRFKVVRTIFAIPSKFGALREKWEAALKQARQRQPDEWAALIRSDDLPD